MERTIGNNRLAEGEKIDNLPEDVAGELALKQDRSQKGQPAGYAGLNELGQVHDSQLPFSMLEQGIGFENSEFLYTVYGEDESWESIRCTRDGITQTTTGIQSGPKPDTLAEVEVLIYT